MPGSNPAGRLLAVLSVARNTSRERPTHEAWEKALGVPLSDGAPFFERLASVLTLPNQTVIALARTGLSDEDLAVYTEWKGPVQNVLSALNLHQHWQDAKAQLTDDVITKLRFCDIHLAKHWNEPQIDPDAIGDIQTQVDELFEEVLTASIDADIKRFILEHLDSVTAALRKFRIDGSIPVEQAVQSALGGLAERKSLRERIFNSETGRKFIAVMNGVYMLVRTADTAVDLFNHLQLPAAEAVQIESGESPKLIDPPGSTDLPRIREGEVVSDV